VFLLKGRRQKYKGTREKAKFESLPAQALLVFSITIRVGQLKSAFSNDKNFTWQLQKLFG
jgi:hypothetical protein